MHACVSQSIGSTRNQKQQVARSSFLYTAPLANFTDSRIDTAASERYSHSQRCERARRRAHSNPILSYWIDASFHSFLIRTAERVVQLVTRSFHNLRVASSNPNQVTSRFFFCQGRFCGNASERNAAVRAVVRSPGKAAPLGVLCLRVSAFTSNQSKSKSHTKCSKLALQLISTSSPRQTYAIHKLLLAHLLEWIASCARSSRKYK